MDANIKKRSLNFTEEEEELLVAVVEQHKNVLESKKTGAFSWKEKDAIWTKVESAFNNSNKRNLYRNKKHLKEKFNNLKKKTKQKSSVNRAQLLQTGGGTFNPLVLSKVDETIQGIIGRQVDGLHGNYDGEAAPKKLKEIVELDVDAYPVTNHQPSNVELPNDDECIDETVFGSSEEQQFEVPNNVNWTAYSSQNLKQTPSKKLLTKAGKKFTDKTSLLIGEKRSFLKYQRECFEKEHKLKMELLIKKNKIADKKLLLLNN